MVRQINSIDKVTERIFKERLIEQFGSLVGNGTGVFKAFETINNHLIKEGEINYSNYLFVELLKNEDIKKLVKEYPMLLKSVIGYQGLDFYGPGTFLAYTRNEKEIMPLNYSVKHSTALYDGNSLIDPTKKQTLVFEENNITLISDEGDFVKTVNYNPKTFMETNRTEEIIFDEPKRFSFTRMISAVGIYFGNN